MKNEIPCILSGMLGSFMSRNNESEGYWAVGKLHRFARENNSTSLAIQIHPDETVPENALIESVRSKYRTMLTSILSEKNIPVTRLVSAKIFLNFERTALLPATECPHPGAAPFLCNLTFESCHGKVRTLQATGWSAPHDPENEHQSARKEMNR